MTRHARWISKLLLPMIMALFVAPAYPVEFILQNDDEPSEGLNDSRASGSPTPGNPGLTLGAQRHQVIEAVFEYLGGIIQSGATFNVSVRFSQLHCDAETAVLGGGAPVNGFIGFQGAPDPQALYPAALANLHAGRDLDPDAPEIELVFNSQVDGRGDCLNGGTLYYGLDGGEPDGQVNFYSIVLHEMVHGLGFVTFMGADGAVPGAESDPFLKHLFVIDYYTTMDKLTPYTRVQAVNHLQLGFYGSELSHRSGALTSGYEPIAQLLNGDPVRVPLIYNPDIYEPGSSISHWVPAIAPRQLMTPYSIGDIPVVQLSEIEKTALAELGFPIVLPFLDRDGDGIADRKDGSPDDPSVSTWPWLDEDKDNLPDEWEAENNIALGFDNTFIDSDNDGFFDLMEYAFGTNPRGSDTDNDGVTDYAEYRLNLDPTDPQSCPHAACKQPLDDLPSLALKVDNFLEEDVDPRSRVRNSIITAATPAKSGGAFLNGVQHLGKITSTGHLDPTFGQDGMVTAAEIGAARGDYSLGPAVEDSQGLIYTVAAVGPTSKTYPGAEIFEGHIAHEYLVLRLLPDGSPDPAFTPFKFDRSWSGLEWPLNSYTVDGSGRLVVGFSAARDNSDRTEVVFFRLTTNGLLDTSFGVGGRHHYAAENATIGEIYTDSQDAIYARIFIAIEAKTVIAKIDASGRTATSFGENPLGLAVNRIGGDAARQIQLHIRQNELFLFIFDYDEFGSNPASRVERRTLDGALLQTYSITTLPTNGFPVQRCQPSSVGWFCAVDEARQDLLYDDLTYFVQSFDVNFQPLSPVVTLRQQPVEAGTAGDPEDLINLLPAGNDRFLLIARLALGDMRGFGSRVYDLSSGWQSGTDVTPLVHSFKGSLDRLLPSTRDPQGRFIVAYQQMDAHYRTSFGLVRFLPSGERDRSFAVNGELKLTVPGISAVSDVKFNHDGEMLIGLGIDSTTRIDIYKVRFDDPKQTGDARLDRIYSESATEYFTYYSATIEPLPNGELLLHLAKARIVSDSGSFEYSDPQVSLVHLSADGALLRDMWPDGRYTQDFPGVVTEFSVGFYNLQISGDEVFFVASADGSYPYLFTELRKFSIAKPGRNGHVEKVFTLPNDLIGAAIYKPKTAGTFLIYGKQCLISSRCYDTSLDYYSLVDDDGVPLDSFNGGEPLLVRNPGRVTTDFLNIYELDGNFYAQGTAFLGYLPIDSGVGSYANIGNAFYMVSFNREGRVRHSQPFIQEAPGNEIYTNCILTSEFDGICEINNDHFNDIRMMRWRELDVWARLGPNDSDADGIPDQMEREFGLNAMDPVDAQQDPDGDGVDNLQEYLDGKNPNIKDYPPTLNVPENIVISSTGAFTPIALAAASAISATGEAVPVESTGRAFFEPGVHTNRYKAVDPQGNVVIGDQVIQVLPRVFVPPIYAVTWDQAIEVRAYLNGKLPRATVLADFGQRPGYDNVYAVGSGSYVFHWNNELESKYDLTLRHSIGHIPEEKPLVEFELLIAREAELTPRRRFAFVERDETALPEARLIFEQNGKTVTTADIHSGPVIARLWLDNNFAAEVQVVDWNLPTEATQAGDADRSVTFDPSDLSPGTYTVQATFSHSQNPSQRTLLSGRLGIAAYSDLMAFDDNDADGLDDRSEGHYDGDNDGLADYQDADVRPFLLPAGQQTYEVVEADAYLKLSLGEVAFTQRTGSALVTVEEYLSYSAGKKDLNTLTGLDISAPVEFFDFEIHSIGTKGGSAQVVLPIADGLPDNTVLNYFMQTDGWQLATAPPAGINLASAAAISGICPGSFYTGYKSGLHPGDECVRIELVDGGPADTDAAADFVIRFRGRFIEGPPDPVGGGAPPSQNPPQKKKKGGSMAWDWLWLLGLQPVQWCNRRLKQHGPFVRF